MPPKRARLAHVEALLGLYRILGVEQLDVETVVWTYDVPTATANAAFEVCVSEGYLIEKPDKSFLLTEAGEERIDELVLRGVGF